MNRSKNDFDVLIVHNRKEKGWHTTKKALVLNIKSLYQILGTRIYKKVILVGFDEHFLGDPLFLQTILPVTMDDCKLELK